MTAAYMQILIHATNSSLFPDADPNSVTWTGPPSEIVIVQSILYASLATSFLAAFLAMLGKQWISRYIRNRGGSTAERSRDRQRKLDGLRRWHFYLVIESLPVMLQLALLLLGCALSIYLWTINRTVAWVFLTFTLYGVASYVFLTLAATLYHDCPFQTPSSLLIRAAIGSIKRSEVTFARLLRSLFLPIRNLGRTLRHPRFGVRSLLSNLGYFPRAPITIPLENIQVDTVVELPTWNFGETSVDLEACKGDVCCISWMLDSATDSDVVFYTARFATDTTLYPEIAHVLSPRVLAEHFLECLSDGRVVPGKLDQASMVGMALASVLSIQLCMEPERGDLRRLSNSIHHHANTVSESQPIFLPGVAILRIVSQNPEPAQDGSFLKWDIFSNISYTLPTARKLCLSRTILQTVWRWRQIQGPTAVFNLEGIDQFCKALMGNGDHVLPTLKTNCFLILAIFLGDQVGDIKTLFTPDTRCVISPSLPSTSLIE